MAFIPAKAVWASPFWNEHGSLGGTFWNFFMYFGRPCPAGQAFPLAYGPICGGLPFAAYSRRAAFVAKRLLACFFAGPGNWVYSRYFGLLCADLCAFFLAARPNHLHLLRNPSGANRRLWPLPSPGGLVLWNMPFGLLACRAYLGAWACLFALDRSRHCVGVFSGQGGLSPHLNRLCAVPACRSVFMAALAAPALNSVFYLHFSWPCGPQNQTGKEESRFDF